MRQKVFQPLFAFILKPYGIFRIVLEWCYLKQITAWGYKIYYLGEITL